MDMAKLTIGYQSCVGKVCRFSEKAWMYKERIMMLLEAGEPLLQQFRVVHDDRGEYRQHPLINVRITFNTR